MRNQILERRLGTVDLVWRARWADLVSLLQGWEYVGVIKIRERLG